MRIFMWAVIAVLVFQGCNGSSGGSGTTIKTTSHETNESSASGSSSVSGSSDSTSVPAVMTGVFVDDKVEGLTYRCDSDSKDKRTNINGEFTCKTGDKITFKFGDLVLGKVDFSAIVTPYTLTDDDEYSAVNIARLLQTADNDNNPDNGIILDDALVSMLGTGDNNFDDPSYSLTIGAKLGKTFVTQEKAVKHLKNSFNTYSVNRKGGKEAITNTDRVLATIGTNYYALTDTAIDSKEVTLPSAEIKELHKFGNKYIFAAYDAGKGLEPWVTDGTVLGTHLVKDINKKEPELNIANVTAFGSKVFFTAETDLEGKEPWVSDGTDAGTFLLKDILVGVQGSKPKDIFSIGNKVFFSAYNTATGKELYVTDGTKAGTVLVKDIYAGSGSSFIEYYFPMDDGNTLMAARTSAKGIELWKTDGTEAGTVLIKDIRPGSDDSNPHEFIKFKGEYYFVAHTSANGTEIWKTDGTEAGTVLAIDVDTGAASSNPTNFYEWKGELYFAAFSVAKGTEIWKTDGTKIGTVLVKDIRTGSNNSYPHDFIGTSTLLYFVAEGSSSEGRELWQTDGTDAGTVLVVDKYAGSNDSFSDNNNSYINIIDDELYAILKDGAGDDAYSLYTTKGAGANALDIVKAGLLTKHSKMQKLNGKLYFMANDGNGESYELWESDGTSVGTKMFDEVNENGETLLLSDFAVVGTELYMSMTDVVSNVYKTDISTSKITRITDVTTDNDGSLNKNNSGFSVVGDKAYFTANDGVDKSALWVTDGTEAGTIKLRAHNSTNTASSEGTLFADEYYYSCFDDTAGWEPCKVNLITKVNTLIKDISPGIDDSEPFQFTVNNGKVYFLAMDGIGGDGHKLWATDGTDAGTIRLSPERMESYDTIAVFNGLVYAKISGELYKTDGTVIGTVLVKDINTSGDSDPYSFTELNGKLYFTADNGTDGAQLWVTDGTDAGTKQVKIINPDGNSWADYFIKLKNKLYFTAETDAEGLEVWETDGTTEGTKLVQDLNVGAGGSSPESLFTTKNTLFFKAKNSIGKINIYKIGRSGKVMYVEGETE